jgi:ADP-ribose pyrophosphatase YjhB (NUDIX family)
MSHIDSCAAREARPGSGRTYPHRPYLGVSVAVFRAGRVLLARRTKPPYAGAFSLPGGLVEVGETLAAAALREVQEEHHIDARIVGFNQFVESIDRDNAGKIRHHYVIASFVGEWIAGEAKSGPDAEEAVWVLPGCLAGLECTPHIAAVVEAAQRALNARVRAGQP